MVGDILQPTHLIFVLVIALLVLGPKKLPEVGRQLGNGLRDFRAAINGEHSEHKEVAPSYEEPAAEHGFAQAPSETVTEHQFAHAPVEAPPEGHDFAHETTSVSGDEGQVGTKPASDHEFAYETSEPADKRPDTLG
jgi:sec-independent protein translocase protein TatA